MTTETAEAPRPASGASAPLVKTFGWASLTLMAAYLLNNVLIFWFGWPGIGFLAGAGDVDVFAIIQVALYVAALAVGLYLGVLRQTTLRHDSAEIAAFNNYLIRGCFWAVLLVGLADSVVSFLRVEGLLDAVVGDELGGALGRSQFRGPYLHFPLVAIGFVLAAFTRTLGFTWLALLVVVAELGIVIGRFVFSYEQAFMADLVRFWYSALFLFASAYTLFEDGHVRVDVFYAGFRERTKGFVNAFGCIVMGMLLCWTVLLLGTWGKANVINSPILAYEITQSGFGAYFKYMMAGFLGVFAVTMLIQFTSYLLESVADIRGEPGKRQIKTDIAH